ncbi:MAG: hypothetical protein CMJ39_03685 [Phycisphaerae bacterium]|nr:hypothetical protein [Phycisphaerae bacterium]
MTTETDTATPRVPIDFGPVVTSIRDPRLGAELLRFLVSKGGSASRKEVKDHFGETFTFSPELDVIPEGKTKKKWWVSLQFNIIALVRAGFFERSGGRWRITEEGRGHAFTDPEDIAEISRNRYNRGIQDVASVKTWRVKANENWNQYLDEGFVGCGWSTVGNINKMSISDIEDQTKSLREDGEKVGKGAARQLRYMRDMPIGSMVIATDGMDTVVGIGRVTGPYFYTEEGPLAHRRAVEWLNTTPLKVEKQKWKHRIQPIDQSFLDELQKRLGSGQDPLQTKRQYWTISADQNSDQWRNFIVQGVVAADFSFQELSGDVTDWQLEEIYEAMRSADPEGPKPTNNALGLFNFANKMKVGDILIAKTGSQSILGVGVVTSDYEYQEDASNQDYAHVRQVDWVSKTPFEAPCRMAGKSLTDVTPWPGFASRLVEPSPDWEKLKPFFQDDQPDADGDEPTIPPHRRVSDASFLSSDESQELLHLLRTKRNMILQGAPGTGKTYIARQIAKALTASGSDPDKQWELVQFHQSYGYEDFIEGFRPDQDGNFKLRDGIFKTFCRRAASDPDSTYVFIIDEINRGNLSRILGELMVLLEHDKRDPEFAMQLAYSGNEDDCFYVPANVMILGLMNTADRSLAVVDYALRRRFGFYTLPPRFDTPDFAEHLADKGVSDPCVSRIKRIMTSLNHEISESKALGRGFVIGHSFFCPRDSVVEDEMNWVNQVLRYEIQPLLEEYCGTQQALLERLQAIIES